MNARIATILILLSLAGSLPAVDADSKEAAKKSKISKTAPRVEEPGGKKGIDTGDAPKQDLPSLGDSETSAAQGDAIKLKIKGEASDEIPVVVDPPPLDIPFKQVVGFSRPGQTERVLTGFVEHLPANEILNLAILDSRQALSPGAIRLPRPPFIQMEVPPGLEVLTWQLRVKDQETAVVYSQSSGDPIKDLLVWDGFENGQCKIKVGIAYLPELTVRTVDGRTQPFHGDPVLFDAMRYDEGGDTRVEFRNSRLFLPQSEELAKEGIPLMKSVLALMRTRPGKPYEITVAGVPGDERLAQYRLRTLQRFLPDVLVRESDAFVFRAVAAGDRGDITTFGMAGPATGARP